MEILLIRAEATREVGTGHVMRCLALAQEWREIDGHAIFVMNRPDPGTKDRISQEGFEISDLTAVPGTAQDAELVAQIARERGAAWAVVDGYIFDAGYQRTLKNLGVNVLLVDDGGKAEHYFADVVLNQNVYAREQLYSHREAYTRLMLGVRFAMLRKEFRSWSNWRRNLAPVGHRVLVTMGGSDPNNITSRVIETLALIPEDLDVVIAIGNCNPHFEALQTDMMKHKRRMRLVKNANMPEMMAWADIAISSSGTTTAELCMLGLPSILVDVAPNQTPVAQELARIGAAIHLNVTDLQEGKQFAQAIRNLLISYERRSAISEAARCLVDGMGAQRVVSAIRGFDIRLRPVKEKDCRLIWEWANDPEVRSASFNQELIPWERHVEWFQSHLLHPESSRMMVAVDRHQRELGIVRFNLEKDRAIVSISLDRSARGQGYATGILKTAVHELFLASSALAVDAFVKPQNEASKRLFERAGFKQNPSMQTVHGQRAVHYVLMRDNDS